MNEEFLAHRRMLLGLAYRLLGTLYDAEDVLQEAYLRWTRADRSEVVEPRRYLTRVVARLAIDALRARQARREEYVGTWLPEPVHTSSSWGASAGTWLSGTGFAGSGSSGAGASARGFAGGRSAAAGLAGAGRDRSGFAVAGHAGGGPGGLSGGGPFGSGVAGGGVAGGGVASGGMAHGLEDVIDTSDLSIAVLHLMERLTPPQRAVYVLRTAFELPYAEIAAILDRSEEDCRQLHRRAGAALAGRARFSTDPAEHARLLDGFVAAARDGDIEGLEQLLHDDVIAWNDGGGKVRTALNPIRGRAKVVRFFVGIMRDRARAAGTPFTAAPTGVNGQYALLVDASYQYTMCVSVVDGRIQDLFQIANPAKLSTFDGERS
ncbi:sigma-70 family RNA polymerase sigma factor [Dactylosporangium sp. NPDC049525]|uniref:sigma-70 family RNA polymerase sigma factor n=1 Tax=Dactylosporangium sp. NPDC049525 TaxID=3154730 RepID=UPI00342EB3AC